MGDVRTEPRLDSIAFAKSPAQEKFVKAFDGKLKGRYLRAFLVGLEYLGSEALRKQIEEELGQPSYPPDQFVAARDAVVVFDRAVRAGISVERVGELVLPAYKRAHPDAFVGKTMMDAFDILEHGYREDTTYGGVSPQHQKTPGCVRVFRTNSPLPCQYFVGVLKGLLRVFGVDGTISEIGCQWLGAKSCCFEARWNP